MTGQADLACSIATTQQNSRAEIKSLRTRQSPDRAPRDHFRLVEPALRLLIRMQGNGNHRDPPHRHCLFQPGNRLCQHLPQHRRRWANLLKLEQMDQVPQPGFVAAIGDRALKWRIHPLAEQAPLIPTTRLRAIHGTRKVQDLTTDWAIRSLQRSDRHQTAFTNGEPRNSKKWGTTDTAIGREKSEE